MYDLPSLKYVSQNGIYFNHDFAPFLCILNTDKATFPSLSASSRRYIDRGEVKGPKK